MAEENQDGQKTIVAFVVGLLIGGMLVWAFSGPVDEAVTETGDDVEVEMSDEESADEDASGDAMVATETPTLSVGEGEIDVPDQAAGMTATMNSATYPVSEGWVGVRSYDNGQLGRILGVVRFSESQGLVPEDIILQAPTVAGREYAVVVFTEDGDFDFSLSSDVQIDQIFDTFTAE